jgi:transposase-like protein
MSVNTNGRGTVETEVVAKAKRRRFSAKYKLRILRAAESCTEVGELSALLRREGLYSSHLTTWRRQREQGELDGLSAKKRGPKPKEKNPLEKRLKQLEREIAQLTKRAERAEALVELQKKVSELLGVALPTPNSDESTGSSS